MLSAREPHRQALPPLQRDFGVDQRVQLLRLEVPAMAGTEDISRKENAIARISLMEFASNRYTRYHGWQSLVVQSELIIP